MHVLMAVPEMVPYAKTGGLADVAHALPRALVELGVEVSAVLPCYRGIEKKFKPEPAGLQFTVPVLVGDHYLDRRGEILRARLEEKINVYFVKNDVFYDREYLYTTPEGDYPDNCARFMFFCRGVLQFLKKGLARPQVIHCHDWQTALIPIYLKTIYKEDPELSSFKTMLTIHNLGYQGIFWHWDMKLLGLPWEYFHMDYLEYYGKINLLKGGIVFADKITTVSKGYAREIQTPEYGYGLDGVLRNRAQDLHGIVNGIDYTIWNPQTDPHLPANYSLENLESKAKNKKALQEELGLKPDPAAPLVASISRLADQKGFDIITAAFDEMMKLGVQFALLGTGDKKYHEIFPALARRYPGRAAVKLLFDEALAHRIEAGADIFIMPSRYEPCGLNQLISLKYGTVPVVRATGGLDDTVQEWDPVTRTGNGFKFKEYKKEAFLKALKKALHFYQDPRQWRAIMEAGMKEDHSWSASAKEYARLYESMVD